MIISKKWLEDNEFRCLHLGVVHPTYQHRDEFKYGKVRYNTINDTYTLLCLDHIKNIDEIKYLADLERK